MAEFISLDFEDGLSPAVAAMIKRAKDLEPAMQAIADYLVFSTSRRFETQTGPDGRTWTPSRRALGRDRDIGGGPGKTLVDSGLLLRFIDSAFGPDFAVVGSNRAYARAMQEGDTAPRQIRAHVRTIKQAFGRPLGQSRQVQVAAYLQNRATPARPFIGLDADDRAAISDIFRDHLEGR